MNIETKQVVRGKTTSTRLFPEDLQKLKALRRNGESLVLTLNRVLSEVNNEPTN